jgi:hypothetical protein
MHAHTNINHRQIILWESIHIICMLSLFIYIFRRLYFSFCCSIHNWTTRNYRTYCNDSKNQRHGQKGRNASHRTVIARRLTKDEDRCPFSISVFQDENSYFIKSRLGSVSHQFHPRRDQLSPPHSNLPTWRWWYSASSWLKLSPEAKVR